MLQPIWGCNVAALLGYHSHILDCGVTANTRTTFSQIKLESIYCRLQYHSQYLDFKTTANTGATISQPTLELQFHMHKWHFDFTVNSGTKISQANSGTAISHIMLELQIHSHKLDYNFTANTVTKFQLHRQNSNFTFTSDTETATAQPAMRLANQVKACKCILLYDTEIQPGYGYCEVFCCRVCTSLYCYMLWWWICKAKSTNYKL